MASSLEIYTGLARGYGVELSISAPTSELLLPLPAALFPLRFQPGPAAGPPDLTIRREGEWLEIECEAADQLFLRGRFRELELPHRIQALAHITVAQRAPGLIFVHAGVLELPGGGLVLLPGYSHSGKSSLTAELLKLGARYFSDEYAVVDSKGAVWPFPRRLQSRREDRRYTLQELGWEDRDELQSQRATLVVSTTYEPGSQFEPQMLSPAQTVLELLTHTVAAKSRPTESIACFQALLRTATCWRGPRGEADVAAQKLLQLANTAGPRQHLSKPDLC